MGTIELGRADGHEMLGRAEVPDAVDQSRRGTHGLSQVIRTNQLELQAGLDDERLSRVVGDEDLAVHEDRGGREADAARPAQLLLPDDLARAGGQTAHHAVLVDQVDQSVEEQR